VWCLMGSFSSKLGLFLPDDNDVVDISYLNSNQTLIDQRVSSTPSTYAPVNDFPGEEIFDVNGGSIQVFDGNDLFSLFDPNTPGGMVASGFTNSTAQVAGGGATAIVALQALSFNYKPSKTYLIIASGFVALHPQLSPRVATSVYVNTSSSDATIGPLTVAYSRMNLAYYQTPVPAGGDGRIPFRIQGNYISPPSSGTISLGLWCSGDPTAFGSGEFIGRPASAALYTNLAVYDQG